MKRLIPAGILLIAVIVSYVLSLRYITVTCDKAEKLVLQCEEEYKNGGNPCAVTEELTDMWDEKEKILSFFVNHDRIDEIELELSSLSVMSGSNEEILFYEHIENIKMLLHQVKEDTEISTHSIF